MGSDTFILVFKESVRGLTIGAPVDFRGVVVGEVLAIDVNFDPVKREITVPVRVRVDTGRLRGQRGKAVSLDAWISPPHFGPESNAKTFFDALVARGFRAQLKTANLLTAQLYVALDFYTGIPKTSIDWGKLPAEFPTRAGSLQELQATLASVANKLDQIPFDAISKDLQQTLQNGGKLMKQLDEQTAPEARAMLADARKTLLAANKLIEQVGAETAPEARAALAEIRKTMATLDKAIAPGAPLQRNLQEALREVSRAAQAFRVLADYLERHPESLLRGKKADEK